MSRYDNGTETYVITIKDSEIEAGKNSNENDKADDIGTGGNYADDGDRRENGILIISDGTVQVFVAETALFDEGKSEKVSYEIKRKDTQIVLSGSLDGTGATLKAEIEGIISGDELKDAVAILKVKPEGQGSKPEKHADIKNEHWKHVAVFGGEDVQIGYYDVRVWANFYNTPNYSANPNYNEPPEVNQRLYRGKSDRKIIVKKMDNT